MLLLSLLAERKWTHRTWLASWFPEISSEGVRGIISPQGGGVKLRAEKKGGDLALQGGQRMLDGFDGKVQAMRGEALSARHCLAGQI